MRDDRISYAGDATHPHDRVKASAVEAATARVGSVDALRGFAMFWILAGDAFAWALHDMAAGKEGPSIAVVQFISDQFKHVKWDGLNFYDLPVSTVHFRDRRLDRLFAVAPR